MFGLKAGVWFLFLDLVISRRWFLSHVGKFSVFQFVPVIVCVIMAPVVMLCSTLPLVCTGLWDLISVQSRMEVVTA